ncbi:MAG: 30S ribosomal protein S24e [Candidatus Diapherotrites archaeon]|nr:30S ribosomal protein S24e [Candidatus Diapherotrites archaeon]
MNIEIKNERVNRLLNRTEIECIAEGYNVTPSREEIVKQIAAKKGVSENQVLVDKIEQEYGTNRARVYVKVYESEKALQTTEPKYKIERHKKKKEEKEEAPKESSEETKEEKKEE